jgi:hypothetical protein
VTNMVRMRTFKEEHPLGECSSCYFKGVKAGFRSSAPPPQ